MAEPVPALWCGAGVLEATSGDFVGRVQGTFDDGFYTSGPSGEIFTVMGPRHWPGPLHLVVDGLPVLPSLHDVVSVAGGVLAAGALRARLDGAPRWAPRLPGQLRVGRSAWLGLARPLGVECGSRSGAGVGPLARPGVVATADTALAPVWAAVVDALRRGDLAAAFRRLEGRGAGLTPSGDDVLAGILLVCAIRPDRRPTLGGLARSARTTALSRAFLRWAAAGQSIQPAHALLDAAGSGDRDAMGRAARSLAAVGATSGRALVAGAALAATEMPPAMVRRPFERDAGTAVPVDALV